ncbi:class I SAM-dependent methyltransferase [Pseudaestuariivita rosea]|uniref:class I SAM-dependent methyltransferase n=1 Tax=Pseudaestuariivita rosea TaxID=2763263 RepID=UPI001ABAE816|nr:class I SAM-dependent methyltransferase [Pseudaestuariivita rosea]
MQDGWDASAAAWVTDMADGGDHSRKAILDAPMSARVLASGAQKMLDVGCGEGRFCRMMAAQGVATVGIDPTAELLQAAKAADPGGDYKLAGAEALPFDDGSFPLVVSYLTLIDIADARTGLSEMVRVLAPGGRLLIANLTGYCTASQIKDGGWKRAEDGSVTMTMDRYLEEHSHWAEWRGIRIRNWHRPAAFYMQNLLDLGMQLTFFDEPPSQDPVRGARYNRAPYFQIMEWRKPGG